MTHDHDRGLADDLTVLSRYAERRRALLKWGMGLSALPLLACAGSSLEDDTNDSSGAAGSGTTGSGTTGSSGAAGTSSTPTTATTAATTTTASNGTCNAVIPEETAGPYPGDGTNGKNALTLTSIVRSDIRSSIDGASGVAEGVVLTVTLKIVDGQNSCKPLAGYAVYIWHCDRAGNYSMYSAAAASENYLRGVQETDADGTVTFTTTFPGCYSGRWPHIHFEVYPSLGVASSGQNAVATSQLALPEAACDAVYATSGYETSVKNLAGISLATDNIFNDGATLETPATSGDVTSGFSAELVVTI
jgi:protocatechuate 3,4-dioxygenase beta subunit